MFSVNINEPKKLTNHFDELNIEDNREKLILRSLPLEEEFLGFDLEDDAWEDDLNDSEHDCPNYVDPYIQGVHAEIKRKHYKLQLFEYLREDPMYEC